MGYIPTVPDLEYWFDLPNYAIPNAKSLGISQTACDSERMNIIFIVENLSLSKGLILRDEIAKVAINKGLLQDSSCDLEVLEEDTEIEKNKKLEKRNEAEKVKALFPENLAPPLREFLLYNLNQGSLLRCPLKKILQTILMNEYGLGFPQNGLGYNSREILITVSEDGQSFSLTDTYIINDLKSINDNQLHHYADPIQISSTFSFRLKEDGEIDPKCDKVYMQSSDEALVRTFSSKIRAAAQQARIDYEKRDEEKEHIMRINFLCHAKLQQIAAELPKNKEDSIYALHILIERIQNGWSTQASIEQANYFYQTLELLEKYCHVALNKKYRDEEACESALVLNGLILEHLFSKADPIALRIKISPEEIEKYIHKKHIPPEIIKKSLERINLELINRMTSLAIPKKFKFEPVYPEQNWREAFQKNANTISPQKEWAYKASKTVGITLAVCFSVALVTGVLVVTGGLGAIPLISTAVALALSPPTALPVLGALLISSIASVGFAWWHNKDVAACKKSSEEYIYGIENKVKEIRAPIAQEDAKREIELVQGEKKRDGGAITAIPGFQVKSAQKIIAESKSAALFGGANPNFNSPTVVVGDSATCNKSLNNKH
ncbi:MAG: hypothetical protein K0R24_763 [Gammaproteobacteria bacterium]|jgi:hypothetical protein|nr:hypothetical protein [Gammaproteobacteria bacterium]